MRRDVGLQRAQEAGRAVKVVEDGRHAAVVDEDLVRVGLQREGAARPGGRRGRIVPVDEERAVLLLAQGRQEDEAQGRRRRAVARRDARHLRLPRRRDANRGGVDRLADVEHEIDRRAVRPHGRHVRDEDRRALLPRGVPPRPPVHVGKVRHVRAPRDGDFIERLRDATTGKGHCDGDGQPDARPNGPPIDIVCLPRCHGFIPFVEQKRISTPPRLPCLRVKRRRTSPCAAPLAFARHGGIGDSEARRIASEKGRVREARRPRASGL